MMCSDECKKKTCVLVKKNVTKKQHMKNIELGDRHHAFRRCLEHAKYTYGLQVMRLKEQITKKQQISNN